MDITFSSEDLQFRDEVRDWISGAYTPELRARNAMSKNGYLDKEGMVEWQKKLYEKGWIAPNWPQQYGGAGFTATEKFIFQMETAIAGTPATSPMGLSMVAPVIMEFGTEEQKAKHLPSILSSDVWWCQGYSEPGSGSDLASLKMSAVRDGDDYVLNGSKIWTTHAQWADWMFCLVRTSYEGKPQQGITFLIFPMTTAGITVRPIPTIDQPAEGQQEINEVFFEDVRVPIAESLIGKENEGWTYAKYLLEFERGSSFAPRLTRALNKAKNIARMQESNGATLMDDADFAQKISEMEIKVESLNATELKFFSSMVAGQRAGPESSMLKCLGSELQQEISEIALEAIGGKPGPLVEDSWAHLRERANEFLPIESDLVPVTANYFSYRKTSIYAGSNEIQRNILAKLVLGL